MAIRSFALFALLAQFACGSKSPAPTTAPATEQPEHHHAAEAPPDASTSQPAPAEKPAEAPVDPKAELLAAETDAWNAAKPVFDQACAGCHTTAGKKASKKKLDHFNFDSYPPGGHHAATIGFTIRDVLGISGKKPTMPDDKPGSVKGDDLAKIKAWTDAWEAAEKAGAHPAGPKHDHSH
jgi:mono/diheme cytochrome c family protein